MPDTVQIDTADAKMGLYMARPATAAKAAVVVIQEAFGVNDHIEDVTRRFAGEGYLAVSPHLFHRSGDPKLSYEDISQVMPHMQALSSEGIANDLDATLDFLAKEGLEANQIGIVGFCMGGTVAFIAATRYPLGAAVSFYGGGIAQGRFGLPAQTDVAGDLKCPWLGLYGDLDQSIPVAEVETLRQAAARSGVRTEVVRYADAGHGFHCDARDSYHEASAKDAWGCCLSWFSDNLLGPAGA
jgi:carboxymethylenebutenolidase